MVYAVQAYLIFADTATRDARLAQATTLANSKPRWDLLKTVLPDSTTLYLEVRYTAKSDQLSIEDSLRKLPGIQPDSWVQYHNCIHDAAGPCPVGTKTTL